jgi:hypothetical protein
VAKRVFISYDYDHDSTLKEFLVGQSRLPDSPFEIADWSIKVASPNWITEARRRIRASDTVAVICGEHTRTAIGVDTEVKISQEESITYFLLKGYREKDCHKPSAARPSDKIYTWTRERAAHQADRRARFNWRSDGSRLTLSGRRES